MFHQISQPLNAEQSDLVEEMRSNLHLHNFLLLLIHLLLTNGYVQYQTLPRRFSTRRLIIKVSRCIDYEVETVKPRYMLGTN